MNSKQVGKIMVIVPPVVNETGSVGKVLFIGGKEKGNALRTTYKALAEQYNCLFLDSNAFVTVNAEEGVHLDRDAHKFLGKAIVDLLKLHIA